MITNYPTLIRMMACEDTDQDGSCTSADKPLSNVEIDIKYVNKDGRLIDIPAPMVIDADGYAETWTEPIQRFYQTEIYPHEETGGPTPCYEISSEILGQELDEEGNIIDTIDAQIRSKFCLGTT